MWELDNRIGRPACVFYIICAMYFWVLRLLFGTTKSIPTYTYIARSSEHLYKTVDIFAYFGVAVKDKTHSISFRMS